MSRISVCLVRMISMLLGSVRVEWGRTYTGLPQLWSSYQPFVILASAHITLLMFSWRSQVNSRLPNPLLWFQPPPYLISAWHVALLGRSSFPQWPSSFGFEVTLSLLSFQSAFSYFFAFSFGYPINVERLQDLGIFPLFPCPPPPRISNRPIN